MSAETESVTGARYRPGCGLFYITKKMKTKIATALKTEYASLGLSQKALDGVASLLEKTINDESGIEAAVQEASVRDLLKVFQSESDALRNAKSTAEKALEEYKKASLLKVEPAKTDPSGNEALEAMLKEMKEKQEALEAKLAAREAQTRRDSIMGDVRGRLRKDGCVNEYILSNVLKSAEVGDTDTVDTLAAKYKPVYDDEFKQAFGNGVQPRSGSFQEEGYKKGAYASEIAALQREGLIPKKD